MNASALWNGTKEYFRPGVKRCRLGMAALGVLVCALCISLMRIADFGVDPFQCLCNGLERVVPFSYGTMYLLLCIVFLIITLLLNPRYVGVTTMLNLFLIGYLVDLFDWLLRLAFPAPSVALRVVLLAAALVMISFAAALYYTANLGVSVYDSIALHLAAKKVAPFRFCRIGTDLVCVLIGLALGYVPGVGTLITAFCMGPLISLFRDKVTEPMMARRRAGAQG